MGGTQKSSRIAYAEKGIILAVGINSDCIAMVSSKSRLSIEIPKHFPKRSGQTLYSSDNRYNSYSFLRLLLQSERNLQDGKRLFAYFVFGLSRVRLVRMRKTISPSPRSFFTGSLHLPRLYADSHSSRLVSGGAFQIRRQWSSNIYIHNLKYASIRAGNLFLAVHHRRMLEENRWENFSKLGTHH